MYALLNLAADLGVPALSLSDFWARKGPDVKSKNPTPLNKLETLLEADLDTKNEKEWKALQKEVETLQRDPALPREAGIRRMDFEQFKTDDGVCNFRAVFGYLGRTGGAIFFDAVPKEVPKLAADVMNVHYPQYYSRERPPHDAQQPNPISFLTVKEGVTFCFAVGARQRGYPADLDAASEGRRWLQTALREVGVGAKTAAGYGIFSDWEPVRFSRAT